jgi:hypothetical protein
MTDGHICCEHPEHKWADSPGRCCAEGHDAWDEVERLRADLADVNHRAVEDISHFKAKAERLQAELAAAIEDANYHRSVLRQPPYRRAAVFGTEEVS